MRPCIVLSSIINFNDKIEEKELLAQKIRFQQCSTAAYNKVLIIQKLAKIWE